MFTLYLYNYSSQEKISEWQKWGASKPNSVLQHYLTQMCKPNSCQDLHIYPVTRWRKGKNTRMSQKSCCSKVITYNLTLGQGKKPDKKIKQAFTSSFRLFILLWVQLATTSPTDSTKQGSFQGQSNMPHLRRSGNDNICWDVIQDQLNLPLTEKIWTPF